MAIIDVVKWEANNEEFCHKFPSRALKVGTQLIVSTSQTALFVKGGKICDEFTEGTYTLSSQNLPILYKSLNIPFGGESPFQAEVWYINQITRLDLKWGTPQPIQLEDPNFKIIVPVRAFGQYGIKVSNPKRFLKTLIGNMNSFDVASIDSYFKGRLISNLSSVISKKILEDQISILNINVHLVELSDFCNQKINKYFEKYGVSLVDFSIMSISVSPDDPSFIKLKEAKATLAKLNIIGRDYYQMERSFDVLEKAAGNNGVGSQIMGLGVGMDLGKVMNSIAGQTLDINTSSPPPIRQESSYFAYISGRQMGGLNIAAITNLINQGEIDADTLVWTVGMTQWVPIKEIPSLSSLLPPPINPESNK